MIDFIILFIVWIILAILWPDDGPKDWLKK